MTKTQLFLIVQFINHFLIDIPKIRNTINTGITFIMQAVFFVLSISLYEIFQKGII